MIKQEAPLLICSDLCLPDGSGLELLAEVRTCNKDTPFIIASCYEKDDYEQEALQHGVTTVSYTHLDVYKRQVKVREEKMDISSLNNYFELYGGMAIFIVVLLEYMNLPGFPAGICLLYTSGD